MGAIKQNSYRSRIFKEYASYFQDANLVFDPVKASRWGKAYDFYLRGWLPENKNAAIIDLACGGGNLLYFFEQRGYSKACGVDISPEQVQLARQIVPEVFQGNVIDFLGSHVNSFDLITGLDIIEHFQKDEVLLFLDLCYQSLRSGGRLVLQTPNAETPWGATHRYNDLTHEVCFNPHSLLRLMHMCGFEQVEAREQGPVPWGYGFISTIRYTIWQSIRTVLKVWNIAETGGSGSGVFTRVFLASGLKA